MIPELRREERAADELAVVRAEMIRELPREERPRERLLARGCEALSDAELLAVLLRTGRPGTSALSFARRLLEEAGGLIGLAGSDPRTLRRPGLGPAKAASVLAAIEVGRRLARAELPQRQPLSRPVQVARYLALRYGHLGQEVMGALYCDARHRLLAERELFRGTLHRAAVEPREVLKEGLLRGAAAVVLFHTHPSGDPAPSREDLLFTRRMARAGEVIGLHLVDHLVVGRGGAWVSLRERGGW
jgi:DNA repair protein RadC